MSNSDRGGDSRRVQTTVDTHANYFLFIIVDQLAYLVAHAPNLKAVTLTLVLLFSLCSLGKAQQFTASVNHYGPENGLSHREVNAIFQDRQGFMWFGTKFGLNRFDGLKFTSYTKERNGLGFDDIQAIAQDADGLLWLMGPANKSSITLFNPVSGTAVSFEKRFNKPRPSTFWRDPQVLLGSPDGTIFFANYKPATLTSYHPRSGLQEVTLPQYKSLTLAALTARNTVWAIANRTQLIELTPDGRVLQSFHHETTISVCLGQRNAGIEFFYVKTGTPSLSKAQLYRIDGAGQRRELPISLIPSMKEGFPPVCYPFDRTGLVWDGSQLRSSTKGTLLDLQNQLAGQLIHPRCFFADKNGWMWLGTSFGVYQVKVAQNYFHRLFYEPANAVENTPAVRGINVIGDKVYVNLERTGLFTCDLSGGSVKSLLEGGTLFYGLSHYQPGKLYVGQRDQLATYDLATGRYTTSPLASAESIWTLHPFSSQYLIAGGLLGLWLVEGKTGRVLPFSHYNQFPELAQAHVLHIAADRRGIRWICAATGLYMVDPAKGVTARYWSGGRGPFKLPADSYQHFYQDPQGLFWLATANAGLIRWDRQRNSHRQFRRTEGLSNDNIYAVYADTRGHLWLSSDYGIMQFDPVRMTTRSYTVQDGITHNEFNRIAHFQATNGQLYFGGLNGITSFNPQGFEREKPLVGLPLRVVSFRQFDNALDKLVDKTEELLKTNRIILRPGDRTSVLEFALLNYTDAQKNVYAYQFKGLDNQWTYQTEPSLRLGNLPYGVFQLLIKGQAVDGQLSSANLAIQVIVLRPFYLRSWFVMLMVFLLMASIWGWGRWRIWRHRQEQTRLQTQINEATHVIAQQAQDLLLLDETKSRFFANISHEFRTPLTVILGMAANQKLMPDPALRQTAGLIERQGSNLLRLINQILDLSRLEAGQMPLHLVRADVLGFIHYVGESFDSMARAKGIHLQFNAEETTLEADFNPDKLQDILANLLVNAIKFTPTGGQVSYEVAVQDSWQPLTAAGYHQELTPTGHLDASWIKITVRDTGPGIEPASLARIFDRFYQQSDDSAERGPAVNPQGGGTGIGLSLVRELVGLMQGGLAVRNRPDSLVPGAEFVVSLPLTRQAPLADSVVPALVRVSTEPSEWVEPAPDAAGDRPVLLLVEDNDDVATYILTCLRETYQVVRAENGQEGIDLALASIPDLILSDVMMPLKDGFALCDTLKNDERTSHIPIVLLTARAAVSDRIAGLRRGADAYLVKPFQREELLVVLGNLLQTRHRLQHYYGQLALGQPPATPVPAEALATGENQFVVKLHGVLAAHLPDAGLDIDLICQLMGMSRNALHRKMSALTGMSINPYLRALRLQKAEELLLLPGLPIAEVAYAVGFDDPKYFSRIFSEKYGVSPSTFRGLGQK